MPRDEYPRRLAAAFALAALLPLLICVLVPQRWVELWLRPYQQRDDDGRGVTTLQLLPEPGIAPDVVPASADSSVAPDRAPPETLPSRDASWWRTAWRDWAADRARPTPEPVAPGPAGFDLLAARLIRAIPDSLWRHARVDTSRAARLAAVRAFYASDLRRALPELRGTMATRKTTEILNREAELFGEYLLLR